MVQSNRQLIIYLGKITVLKVCRILKICYRRNACSAQDKPAECVKIMRIVNQYVTVFLSRRLKFLALETLFCLA